MSNTTLTQFMDRLAGLTVTGVTRAYTHPPAQINTADLPCSYPRLPSLSKAPMTACEGGAWQTFTGELVIVVEPVAQNLDPTNWSAALTLIDNLSAALAGASLAKSKATWTIRQEYASYGTETEFWAIVASVSASG